MCRIFDRISFVDLTGPISEVIEFLQKYKAKYGEVELDLVPTYESGIDVDVKPIKRT